MGRCLWGLPLLAFACACASAAACSARLGDGPGDDGPPGDARPDGDSLAPDAPPDAIVLGAWGAPARVTPAATAAQEDDSTMSSDTLELYYAVIETATKHLYVIKRTSPTAAWGTPARLAINSATQTQADDTPRLSADNQTLYFESGRGGNNGDIYMSTRNAAGTWQTPVPLTEVNTASNEKWFMPCGSGGRYMVISARNGNGDLFEGTLGAGAPTPATPLNSAQSETGSFLTQDCKTVMFASARSGNTLLYQAHRDAVTDPWPTPTLVTDFVTGADQQDPWMSADGRTFTFASNPGANYDIFLSTR